MSFSFYYIQDCGLDIIHMSAVSEHNLITVKTIPDLLLSAKLLLVDDSSIQWQRYCFSVGCSFGLVSLNFSII